MLERGEGRNSTAGMREHSMWETAPRDWFSPGQREDHGHNTAKRQSDEECDNPDRGPAQTGGSVRVSACRECLSLALEPEGVRDTVCVWCDQANDLLRQVENDQRV